MSLPFVDPSLPSGPAPIFGDVDAARGDHLRANNSLLWSNLNYLDAKTGLLVSPVAGMNLQLYQPDGGASLLKFSNVTTGLTAVRGFDIGLDASEQGRIWNYENTDLVIGTNNTEMLLIDNAGNIGIRNGIPLYIYSAGNDKYLSLIHNDTNALISTNSGNIYTDKLVGIGIAPFNPLHVQSTTTPQVRIAYDDSNYITNTVSSVGNLEIGGSGGAMLINLSALQLRSGSYQRIYSSDNLEYGHIIHNGTNLTISTGGTNAGNIVITNTTECTGADTGALQVDGGVHVAKDTEITGDLRVSWGGSGTPVAGWLDDGTPYYINEISIQITSGNVSASGAHGISNAFTNDRIFKCQYRYISVINGEISYDFTSGNVIGSYTWNNTDLTIGRGSNSGTVTFKVKIWYK
jgi:hypothetical protein